MADLPLNRLTLLLLASAASLPILGGPSDKHSSCAHWADIGECESNPGFMKSNCAASCSASGTDEGGVEECRALVAAGACAHDSEVALTRCRASCYRVLKGNLTEDLEGNCFYWSTDGECDSNPEWMSRSCHRSCAILRNCGRAPESAECAAPFECPLERDRDDEANCAERARKGECRSGSIWRGDSALLSCPYTCAVLDPPSASHAVTRPMVKHAKHMDARVPRHLPSRCHYDGFGLRRPLLAATCPHPLDVSGSVPWRTRWRRCPSDKHAHSQRSSSSSSSMGAGRLDEEVEVAGGGAAGAAAATAKTTTSDHERVAGAKENANGVAPLSIPSHLDVNPRIAEYELPPPVTSLPEKTRSSLLGESHPPITVEVLSASPRVRILHNFLSKEEAERIIELATPYYHRSSTARAGSDDKRTSHSATLPSSDAVVSALRNRISFYCGYPEPNIEPLQAVRYHPGEFYKPHHDYYNACETWQAGNRHFTFLIYLNQVEGGGETSFPRLNITITPKAYSALVFNNCLDNGEPDERSLHEGVAPTSGTKYAINGWVRSKNLFSGRRSFM